MVVGCDTAVGGCGALKLKHPRAHCARTYSRRISSSILESIFPPLMMATLNFVFGS